MTIYIYICLWDSFLSILKCFIYLPLASFLLLLTWWNNKSHILYLLPLTCWNHQGWGACKFFSGSGSPALVGTILIVINVHKLGFLSWLRPQVLIKLYVKVVAATDQDGWPTIQRAVPTAACCPRSMVEPRSSCRLLCSRTASRLRRISSSWVLNQRLWKLHAPQHAGGSI